MGERVRYARSGDVSIAYVDIPGGPADVVFVTGFASNVGQHRGHRHLAAGRRRFARVVTFDKRGVGLSERSVGIADLETRMDDVRAVMDAVGLERAHLLGVSEGGPMSILFAATYPDRVQSLTLYGTFARFVRGDDHPWMPTVAEREATTTLVEEYWGSGLVLGAFVAEEERTPEVLIAALAEVEMQSASPKAVVQLLEMNMSIDVRSVLPVDQRPDPRRALHGRRAGSRSSAVATWPSTSRARGCWRSRKARTSRCARRGGRGWTPSRSWSPASEPTPDIDRVLATVLFTDIVSSTELAGRARRRRLAGRPRSP